MSDNDENWNRQVHLEPDEEPCDCGKVHKLEDRCECLHCGRKGCADCLPLSSLDDAKENNWRVCGPECDLAWITKLKEDEARSSKLYVKYLDGKIAELKAKAGKGKAAA